MIGLLIAIVLAALVYWVFCLVLSAGQNKIEERLDRYVAH